MRIFYFQSPGSPSSFDVRVARLSAERSVCRLDRDRKARLDAALAERRELTTFSDSFLFLLRCYVDAADNLPKKHVGGDVIADGAQG